MLLRIVPALAVIVVFAAYASAEGLLPGSDIGLNGHAHGNWARP